MGLSFHDKESLVEVTSSLRFGSVNDHQNSNNRINIDNEENGDDDIGAQERNQIDYQESGRENDIGIQPIFNQVDCCTGTRGTLT